MPSLPPTPSGVVKFILSHSGIHSSFCMAYTGGPPDTAQLTSMAGACQGAWATHLAALLASTYELETVTVVDLANPSVSPGFNGSAVIGTRSGTPPPLSIAALINFGVNRRYRGSKPKIWLPYGVDGDVASPSQWSSSFVSALDAAWSDFTTELESYSGGGGTLTGQVAVSYFSGKTTNPNPTGRARFVPTPRGTPLVMLVDSVLTRVTPGSQRRRL